MPYQKKKKKKKYMKKKKRNFRKVIGKTTHISLGNRL